MKPSDVQHCNPGKRGGGRIETGVVQFGDDWPGVFIRGDNAFALSLAIKRYLSVNITGLGVSQNHMLQMDRATLEGLVNLLESCNLANIE